MIEYIVTVIAGAIFVLLVYLAVDFFVTKS
jgi:hypothetical protein